MLSRHEPFPAIAVNRSWDVVRANQAASLLSEGLPPHLLGPPPNVYRVSLHPEGLARRLANFEEYAHQMLARLRQDVRVSEDAQLSALLAEVESYETVRGIGPGKIEQGAIALPMRLRTAGGELALITTIATFGTPFDVTVSELAIESFFPANDETESRLRALAATCDR